MQLITLAKKFIVLTSFISVCVSHLNGMEATVEKDPLEILVAATEKLSLDEKTVKSPFDIAVINQRFAKTIIDDGTFQLVEKDAKYPYEGGKTIVLVHSKPRIDSCNREISYVDDNGEYNYVTYEFQEHVEYCNSIELLNIEPHYQNKGLGTILTLVALYRGLSKTSNAIVNASSEGTKKIFKALGFEGTANDLYSIDVDELLEINGLTMLEKAFKKLEASSFVYEENYPHYLTYEESYLIYVESYLPRYEVK